MIKIITRCTFLFAVVMLVSGCKIFYSNRMLQTPKNYSYTTQSAYVPQEFKLDVNDVLQMFLYSNDGFRIVDMNSFTGQNTSATNTLISYTIEFDGTAKLPLIGRVKLSGLSVRQAELLLEEKYAEYFIKPFVLLKITNRKILVFPGADGLAKVIYLSSTTTTLAEAIANVGGIPQGGKAFKIKVIRGQTSNPEVFLVDFSTLDGVKKGNMVLQSNDIVYVEPRTRIASVFFQEISPYFTLLNSTLITYSILRQIR